MLIILRQISIPTAHLNLLSQKNEPKTLKTTTKNNVFKIFKTISIFFNLNLNI